MNGLCSSTSRSRLFGKNIEGATVKMRYAELQIATGSMSLRRLGINESNNE